MNTLKYVLAVVVGLVVGLFAGATLLAPSSPSLGGANVSSSGGLSQQALINELNLIANPLVGWNSSSTTWNPSTLGPLGSGTSTATTSITVTGAALGDYVIAGQSATQQDVTIACSVTATNKVTCVRANMSAAYNVVAPTSTVYVLSFPEATFVSPTGL